MSSPDTTLDYQNAMQTTGGQTSPGGQINVALSERLISTALGGVLIAWGIRKRSAASTAGALFGAGLIYRGVTGHCDVYDALGVNTAAAHKPGSQVRPKAPEVHRSITIGKTPEELYDFWHDPINLAHISAHFAEVTPRPGGVTHWRVRGPLRQVLEWDSHYTEEQPGRKLVWESLPGSTLVNRGEITFRPGPDETGSEVRLLMQFEPPLGSVGAGLVKALDMVPRGIAGKSLRRFKSLVETGEIPTQQSTPSRRGRADRF